MSSISDINVALCNALGLKDVTRISKVVLTLEAESFPTIEVTKLLGVTATDAVRVVTEGFKLAPRCRRVECHTCSWHDPARYANLRSNWGKERIDQADALGTEPIEDLICPQCGSDLHEEKLEESEQ